MKKICPRCGASFDCLHGEKEAALCHCTTVKLSPAALSFLAKNYDGCLCHRCLLWVRAACDGKGRQ